MGFWAALGRLFIKEVAPVLAEKGVEALEHRLNRPSPAPVPRVEPLGDAVPTPPVVLPAPVPVAPPPPPAPVREWNGWDADNVFAEADLTKLAVETGVSRDVLSATRNQYLALMETAYRQQMKAAGRKANGSSAGIFASEEFRAFLKSGVLSE